MVRPSPGGGENEVSFKLWSPQFVQYGRPCTCMLFEGYTHFNVMILNVHL